MLLRIRPDEVLDHPTRAALHAAVQDAPGITFRELCRTVGHPSGTARHHLTILARGGLLREEQVGSRIAFLPASDRRPASVVTVLREPGMKGLRDLVASAGRVCQVDLIAYLDGIWSRTTVQNRLRRLVKAGVLRVTPQGRLLFYQVLA